MFPEEPNKARKPSLGTIREQSAAGGPHNGPRSSANPPSMAAGNRGFAAKEHQKIERSLSQAIADKQVTRQQAAGARAIAFAADLTKNADGQRGFDLRGAPARFWSGFAGGAHEAAKDLTRTDGGLTLGQSGGGSVLHSAEYIKGRNVSEDRGEGGLEKRVGGEGAGYLWKRGSAEVAATAGEGSTISSPQGPRRQGNVFDKIENPIQASRNLTVQEAPHQQRSPDTGVSAARRTEIHDANSDDLYKDNQGRDIIATRDPGSKHSHYGRMLDDQLRRKPLGETHAKIMLKGAVRSAVAKRRAAREKG